MSCGARRRRSLHETLAIRSNPKRRDSCGARSDGLCRTPSAGCGMLSWESRTGVGAIGRERLWPGAARSGALGSPALVYSGANQITDTLLLRQTHVQNFSAARNGAYWRDSSRRAPSNLYANTDSFNNSGSSPAPWFAYRADGVAASGSPVSQVSMTLGSTSVRWTWTDGAWFRQQRGSAHKTDGGAQVSASNIVVATVQEVHTGMVDSSGGPVPEFIWAGSGPVSVFTDGKRIDGTWTRATLADVAILTDSGGNVIQLTPGRTWVELVTAGASSS